MQPSIRERDFSGELLISASRSSGAGGQNVNKVSTKIELRFHVESSQVLSDPEKSIILEKLGNKISLEGFLILISQTERSQLKNKEIAIEKFLSMLEKALKTRIKRKATKPTRASKEKRLESKKVVGQKKASRKKPEI